LGAKCGLSFRVIKEHTPQNISQKASGEERWQSGDKVKDQNDVRQMKLSGWHILIGSCGIYL